MAEHFTANSQVLENTKLDQISQALMLGLSVKIMVI